MFPNPSTPSYSTRSSPFLSNDSNIINANTQPFGATSSTVNSVSQAPFNSQPGFNGSQKYGINAQNSTNPSNTQPLQTSNIGSFNNQNMNTTAPPLIENVSLSTKYKDLSPNMKSTIASLYQKTGKITSLNLIPLNKRNYNEVLGMLKLIGTDGMERNLNSIIHKKYKSGETRLKEVQYKVNEMKKDNEKDLFKEFKKIIEKMSGRFLRLKSKNMEK